MGAQFGKIPAALQASLAAALVASSARPCEAQDRSNDREPIIVIGDRVVEALDGVAPIDRIFERDIKAYGDDTLADLMSDLSREQAQDESSRPLLLLNGRRVSSSREISDLPTEAIQRVDVYPAPAAQRFGGSAGQKVMNFVLREQYRSATATLAGTVPTASGGGQSGSAGVSLSQVRGENRSSLSMRAVAARQLLESDRDIEAIPNRNGVDETPFRTLAPNRRRFVVNAVLARQLSKALNLSFNSGGDFERLRRLNGLPDFGEVPVDLRPLKQKVNATGAFIAGKANLGLGRWDLTGIGELGARRTTTATDLPLISAQSGRITERARSTSGTGRLSLEGSGPLVKLPAGDLRLSVNSNLSRSTLRARVRRADFAAEGRRNRTDAGAWLDASVPITKSESAAGVPWRGLSAQLGAGIRSVSDVRTLYSLSVGFNWAPINALNINAAVKRDEQPPSLVQLASPTIETSGVPFFDYVSRRTVEVTEVTGGNSALGRERRRTVSIAMNFLPFGPGPLRVSADYRRLRIGDPIAALPAATASIQSAFPDRFVRDPDGTLVRVDTRPLNLAEEQRDQLHWGFVSRYPWTAGVKGQGDEDADRALGIRVSLDHVWVLKDKISLGRNLTVLNLLNGGAAGEFGGQPRHALEWELGAFGSGLGARLTGRWQSATNVTEGLASTAGSLRFSPLTRHDLRLFAELGTRFPRDRWARDLRLTLIVANLLNSHLKVRDASGLTPLRYQAGYVDPLGRTIALELRKQIS